jgi:hypothetical protein
VNDDKHVDNNDYMIVITLMYDDVVYDHVWWLSSCIIIDVIKSWFIVLPNTYNWVWSLSLSSWSSLSSTFAYTTESDFVFISFKLEL